MTSRCVRAGIPPRPTKKRNAPDFDEESTSPDIYEEAEDSICIDILHDICSLITPEDKYVGYNEDEDDKEKIYHDRYIYIKPSVDDVLENRLYANEKLSLHVEAHKTSLQTTTTKNTNPEERKPTAIDNNLSKCVQTPPRMKKAKPKRKKRKQSSFHEFSKANSFDSGLLDTVLEEEDSNDQVDSQDNVNGSDKSSKYLYSPIHLEYRKLLLGGPLNSMKGQLKPVDSTQVKNYGEHSTKKTDQVEVTTWSDLEASFEANFADLTPLNNELVTTSRSYDMVANHSNSDIFYFDEPAFQSFQMNDYESVQTSTANSQQPLWIDQFHEPKKKHMINCGGGKTKKVSLLTAAVLALLVVIVASVSWATLSVASVASLSRRDSNKVLVLRTSSKTPSSSPFFMTNESNLNTPSQLTDHTSLLDNKLYPLFTPPSYSIRPTFHTTEYQNDVTTSEENLHQTVLDVVMRISGSSVLDMSSPQRMAYEWLLRDQERYHSDPEKTKSMSDDKQQQQRLVQRYVLMILYFSLAGFNWIVDDGYGTSLHECEWNGIGCSDGDKVTSVHLAKNNLEGILVSEIAELPKLEYLNLNSNKIHSDFPVEIGYLSNLKTLNLSSNQMTGTLPTSFQYLSSLEMFMVDQNKFSGLLPPEIGKLESLEHLSMSDNRFEGAIPTAIGLLSNLAVLDLSYNALKGTIPDLLYDLKQLVSLDLSHNEIGGNLQSLVHKEHTTLKVMRLNDNKLSGTIPYRILKFEELVMLSLSRNRITGQIPSRMDGLQKLQILELGYNELTGKIPASIGNIRNLEIVDFHQNKIVGSIPTRFGLLENLEFLNLEGNSLEGSLPSTLSNLKRLDTLMIHGNKVNGFVSKEICGLSLSIFTSDCAGKFPKLMCPCCTQCYF